MDYLLNWRFDDEDITYLRSLRLFDEDFLEYLRNMKFTGDVYAVKEGTPVFPGEPILTIKAPLIQAQFAETALLNILNHQTLIATKSSKICRATGGKGAVLEFGLRRAKRFFVFHVFYSSVIDFVKRIYGYCRLRAGVSG
jgi:nicotinate phosphoribosyltransferase